MSANQLNTLRAAKDAARQLSETATQVRDRHKDLVAEFDEVKYGHASKAEAIANVARLVDGEAARRDEGGADMVLASVAGRLEQRSTGDGSARDQRVYPRLPDVGNFAHGGALTFSDLCWLLPGLMKARLTEIVHSKGSKCGPSPDARAQRLEVLEREIAELEAQHAELTAGAKEVGLELPPLDRAALASRQDQKGWPKGSKGERAVMTSVR